MAGTLIEGRTGICPWHKKDSSFASVYYHRSASPVYRSAFGASSVSLGQHDEPPAKTYPYLEYGIRILQCLFCGKSVVFLEHRSQATEDAAEEVGHIMVAPATLGVELPDAAPAPVRDCFAEASVCQQAGALRGAAVLYRAAVEELVKEQGATGGKLYDQIESLRTKLPDDLVQDLHEARMLGNDSIHAGVTYSAHEVADVAGLIQEAVLVLYVQPAEKQAMRDARRSRRAAARGRQAGVS